MTQLRIRIAFPFFVCIGVVSSTGPIAISQEAPPTKVPALEDTIPVIQPLVSHPTRANLSFAREGILASVHCEEGDRVVPKQLLAELVFEEAQSRVELARAAAESDAAIRVARTQQAIAQQALDSVRRANQRTESTFPASEVEQRQLQLQLAEDELSLAVSNATVAHKELLVEQAVLEQHRLRAPFAGVITRKYLSPGSPVDGFSPMLELVDDSRIRLEGYVSAEQAAMIQRGDQIVARALLPSHSETEPVQGTIEFIDIRVEPIRQQVRVWATLDRGDSLRAGISVEAYIVRRQHHSDARQIRPDSD